MKLQSEKIGAQSNLHSRTRTCFYGTENTVIKALDLLNAHGWKAEFFCMLTQNVCDRECRDHERAFFSHQPRSCRLDVGAMLDRAHAELDTPPRRFIRVAMGHHVRA